MDITVTRMSGTGRTYLRFAQVVPDANGITASEKVGFKIIAEGVNPATALEKAKEIGWRFGQLNRQNGQYEVLPATGAEVPAGELEHGA